MPRGKRHSPATSGRQTCAQDQPCQSRPSVCFGFSGEMAMTGCAPVLLPSVHAVVHRFDRVERSTSRAVAPCRWQLAGHDIGYLSLATVCDSLCKLGLRTGQERNPACSSTFVSVTNPDGNESHYHDVCRPKKYASRTRAASRDLMRLQAGRCGVAQIDRRKQKPGEWRDIHRTIRLVSAS